MAQGWFRQPVTINGEDFEGVETYEQLTTTQVRGEQEGRRETGGGCKKEEKSDQKIGAQREGGPCCMMALVRVAARGGTS